MPGRDDNLPTLRALTPPLSLDLIPRHLRAYKESVTQNVAVQLFLGLVLSADCRGAKAESNIRMQNSAESVACIDRDSLGPYFTTLVFI